MNAVRNELAYSDAPFLSTTVAPTHPVELFRHLTHKIGNTSSLSRRKKPQSMPISGNSPSSQEACACARPFDASQLLYTACPVNSCSGICLALGSGGRLGTLGTTSSSPSTASSRIGSCALPAPPGSSGSSGLTGSDPAGNPRRTETMASHQCCFSSVSCRFCTRCSLCTQLYNRGIVNLSSPSRSMHRLSSKHSNLCGTCNPCHYARL